MPALGNRVLAATYVAYACKPHCSVQRKRRNQRAATLAAITGYLAMANTPAVVVVAPAPLAPAPVVAKAATK
jgi:hypothetical protein